MANSFRLSFSKDYIRTAEARFKTNTAWHVAKDGVLIWATAEADPVNGGWKVTGIAENRDNAVGTGKTRKDAAVSYLIRNGLV